MAMSQQPLPPVNNYTGSFTEDIDGDGVRLNAFEHEDADISFDPLSANRRFAGTADLAVLGTLVFAGPTRETISVMVPDCLMPPVNGTVQVDLRHHVGLSLGPAVNMTNWSPEDHLERALCPASLADTLGLQRRAYWAELNAKDHIEGIHKFQEGHGTSFYECLRRHGIEWFGSRTFFDQRKATNQAIWMDMALARRSG